MGEKDTGKVEGDAAEKMTEAVREYYEAAVDGASAMQSQNARLTRSLYDGSVEALEAQAEFNRNTLQNLAELAREQRETFLRLGRESFDAYDGFLDSLHTYYEEASKKPEELRDR